MIYVFIKFLAVQSFTLCSPHTDRSPKVADRCSIPFVLFLSYFSFVFFCFILYFCVCVCVLSLSPLIPNLQIFSNIHVVP